MLARPIVVPVELPDFTTNKQGLRLIVKHVRVPHLLVCESICEREKNIIGILERPVGIIARETFARKLCS